jgi:hypothetical protein
MVRASLPVSWLALFACGSGAPSSSPDASELQDAAGDPRADAPPPPPDATPGEPFKVIFATSTTHSGDFNGLGGADERCSNRAASAGLDGTFKAWLSSSAESAIDRMAHAEVPYRRTDGTKVADDWNDLIDGDLAAPIELDENGDQVFGDVWTGTLASGEAAGATCSGFDSSASSGVCGSSNSAGAAWTDNIEPPCTAGLRLYCVQQ